MKQLSVLSSVLAMQALNEELGYGEEPLPRLSEKDILNLRTCLELPFQSAFGYEKYVTLSEKAAAQFYYIAKGHKLSNGNKRTAVILMLLFLYQNGYWLSLSSDEMYEMAIMTAESETSNQDGTIEEITFVIENSLIPFPTKSE